MFQSLRIPSRSFALTLLAAVLACVPLSVTAAATASRGDIVVVDRARHRERDDGRHDRAAVRRRDPATACHSAHWRRRRGRASPGHQHVRCCRQHRTGNSPERGSRTAWSSASSRSAATRSTTSASAPARACASRLRTWSRSSRARSSTSPRRKTAPRSRCSKVTSKCAPATTATWSTWTPARSRSVVATTSASACCA